MSRFTVVLATKNRGKLAEFRSILASVPVELVSIDEVLPSYAAPLEDGETFEENALIKAAAVAKLTGLVTIADDSGLEVDALGGRPGVRSARFAHENATDGENNAALLAALTDVPEDGRTAAFRCVICLVDPLTDGAMPAYARGRCEGAIAPAALGGSGFGYDPLFVVKGIGRTYAELTEEEKNTHSHRGLASLELKTLLEGLVRARSVETQSILERARQGRP